MSAAGHRFTLGAAADAELYRFGTAPQAWEPDQNATATINYTSGTTARPRGCRSPIATSG